MGDLIDVTPKHSPWAPGPEVQIVEVYDFYDVPLSGVLEHHGCQHVFQNVFGPGREVSFWIYAPITDVERAWLDDLEGEDLGRQLEELVSTRAVTAAVAHEDLGIIWSACFDGHKSVDDILQEISRNIRALASELDRAAEATGISLGA